MRHLTDPFWKTRPDVGSPKEQVAIDVYWPIPTTETGKVILVAMDYFTKCDFEVGFSGELLPTGVPQDLHYSPLPPE